MDLTNCKLQSDPVHFKLKLMCSLLFSECMIAPTETQHMSPHLPDGLGSLGVPNDNSCSGLYPSTKDENTLTQISCKHYGTCILGMSMNDLCQTYISMLMVSQPYHAPMFCIPAPCVLKPNCTKSIVVILTLLKPSIAGRMSRLISVSLSNVHLDNKKRRSRNQNNARRPASHV